MGATYSSVHIPGAAAEIIKQTLVEFNSTKEPHSRLSLYLAQPIGPWTAFYPKFSLEADQFAKHLSAITGGPVVALLSADESEFFCNLCLAGKDLSFFKINAGAQRKGKQRDPIARKVEALADYAPSPVRAALIETLCDARQVTDSSALLDAFCRAFQIRNARSSYDYIARNDYQQDFDELVPLEHLS